MSAGLVVGAVDVARNNRHTSETDCWFTPTNIIEAARATLDAIDLDPASTVVANQTVQAARFFDELDNGYITEWAGRVFLNPPGGRCDEWGCRSEKGGRSAQKAWWFKLANEYMTGRVESAIFLGFSIEILQTTQVEPEHGANARELPLPLDFSLCFPSRRIGFIDETGLPIKGNTHASVIAFLPPRRDGGAQAAAVSRFSRAFAPIGRVRL